LFSTWKRSSAVFAGPIFVFDRIFRSSIDETDVVSGLLLVRREELIWFLVLLIVLVVAELIFQCVFVRIIFRLFEYKPPFAVSSVPQDPSAETVSFVTKDGVTLRGSIHRQTVWPAKGLILFCPELEGSHWSASAYARGLLDAGFYVISFDFRGQGESDQHPGYDPLHWPTTFEVEDVRAAMRFIQSRPDLKDLPLGVMGVSRGSTAALIAAAESEQVKAVCCEGAYSTDSLMVHFISRWATMYVPRVLMQALPVWHIRVTSVLVRWTSLFVRRRRYIALEQWLPKIKNRSVLFVAGGRDSYVDPEIGRELSKRIDSSEVQFWLVPKAKHNRARHVGPAEYDRRLREFFNKTLAPIPLDARV
jgi:uncharacterized protein